MTFRIQVFRCEVASHPGSKALTSGYRAALWQEVDGVSSVIDLHEWREEDGLHSIGARSVRDFNWPRVEADFGSDVPVTYAWEE